MGVRINGSGGVFIGWEETMHSIVVIALILVVVMAWPAQAGEHVYEGQVKNASGEIDFVLKREHGKTKVKHFHANELLESCSTGSSGYENFGIRGIEVHKRRFETQRNLEFRGSHIAVVDGRLRRGHRASGTVRLYRGFDEMPICDTGTLEWKASD
jgi:hypothetical protein